MARISRFEKMTVKETGSEVSIITTSLNMGRYIENNVRSVLALRGTFKVNHIIMDAESEDNTLNVLKKYPSLTVVVERLSQTEALNRALEIIDEKFPRTEYIGWINADDYYDPDWLEESASTLKDSTEQTAMTCADVYDVNEEGKIFAENMPAKLFRSLHELIVQSSTLRIRSVLQRVIYLTRKIESILQRAVQFAMRMTYKKPKNLTLEMFKTNNVIAQPSTLMKWSVLEKLKKKYGFYFNPRFNYTQDYELWVRILKEGYKIRHINKPLAYLRSHPAQLSQRKWKEQTIETLAVIRMIHRGDP